MTINQMIEMLMKVPWNKEIMLFVASKELGDKVVFAKPNFIIEECPGHQDKVGIGYYENIQDIVKDREVIKKQFDH